MEYFKEKRSFYLNISQHAGQNSIQEEMTERLVLNAENYLKEKAGTNLFRDEIEFFSSNLQNESAKICLVSTFKPILPPFHNQLIIVAHRGLLFTIIFRINMS